MWTVLTYLVGAVERTQGGSAPLIKVKDAFWGGLSFPQLIMHWAV